MRERVRFDWDRFASDCRRACADQARGYRSIADEIGITITDLSRAASGSHVGVDKVFAICDFMKRDARSYFERSTKSGCFTGSNVKHRAVSR